MRCVDGIIWLTKDIVHVITFWHRTSFTGELRLLYGVTPIAVIGGSFFPGLAGHNISEAAAAGCAVLTGCYHINL